MLKKLITKWYVLNKTQRQGTFVLLTLLFIVILFKLFYLPSIEDNSIYFANIYVQNTQHKLPISPSKKTKDTLFFFDPNNISEDEMRQLKFPEKLIKNIINYRNAGGHFYNKESLKKLYTINDSIYNKLADYILIPALKSAQPSYTANTTPPQYAQKVITVELNSADSNQLNQLRGIGKILSARIIKYRNRLGGFYRVDQLKEVYGINDSMYIFITHNNQLLIDTSLIKKINLTNADFKTMIRHFYFNKDIIVKILQIQKNKEPFSSEKLKTITGETLWEKLKHYVMY